MHRLRFRVLFHVGVFLENQNENMNIYKIEQTEYNCDTARAHVIIAKSAKDAREEAYRLRIQAEAQDLWMKKAVVTYLGPYEGHRKGRHAVLSEYNPIG